VDQSVRHTVDMSVKMHRQRTELGFLFAPLGKV